MDVHVKYYSFSRNFGKEAAIYAGLTNARGDYVVTMDADMQDPPALLPEMTRILESGEYDSIATRRVSRKGEPVVRSFCARCFYKLIREDIRCGYCGWSQGFSNDDERYGKQRTCFIRV